MKTCGSHGLVSRLYAEAVTATLGNLVSCNYSDADGWWRDMDGHITEQDPHIFRDESMLFDLLKPRGALPEAVKLMRLSWMLARADEAQKCGSHEDLRVWAIGDRISKRITPASI